MSFSMVRLKQMLRYGLPFILSGTLFYLLTYADRYFIINYGSVADLGLYYIGLSLAGIITLLFAGFQQAWSPILWSTYQDRDAKQFYSKLLDYAFSLSILAIAAISLFSREILMVLTTTDYLESYQVVPWLAFSILFSQVFSLFVPGINIAKKTIHYVWRGAVAVTVNIVLNFLLVPKYGIVGAAAATLAAAAISYVLILVMSQRYYPIQFNFLNYLKITSIAVVTLLLWHTFFLEISWQNILIKVGFMLILLLSIFAFGTIGKAELKATKEIAIKYFKQLR